MTSFRALIPTIRICVGKEHDITVGSIGIDIVLGSTDIIRGVVESGDVVAIHAITSDENPLDIMRRRIRYTLGRRRNMFQGLPGNIDIDTTFSFE